MEPIVIPDEAVGVIKEVSTEEEKIKDPTDGEETSGEITEDESAGGPKKGGIQKRFDEMTKEKRDLERELFFVKGQLAALQTPTERKEDKPVKLSRDDYESDEEYITALVDQKVSILAKIDREKEQDNQKKTVQDKIDSGYEKGVKKYKDFNDVARSAGTHNVTLTMFNEALSGDHFEDVLYYLGSNHKESNRIAALPEAQQKREIIKLEARMETTKPKTIKPDPAPVPILKNKGGTPPVIKDVSKMTMKEKFAVWDEERARKLGLK